MSDTYTEVTRQSWGKRIKSSIGGVVFGLVFFVAGFPVLFLNEGRAVKTAKSLKEGASSVVSVAAERVEAGNEGKLVHFSGRAEPASDLRDDRFGVAERAVKLRRSVEMYQWQESSKSETKKKVGGSTETVTTYSYDTGWSDRLVDSSSFKKPDGHQNPSSMPFQSESWQSDEVTVGAFTLSSGLVGQISAWSSLPMTPESAAALPGDLSNRLRATPDGNLYQGADPLKPAVGDVRVSFEVVNPTTVSVVARQQGSSLGPYPTKAGRNLEMLSMGSVAPDLMFQAAARSNSIMTWILRLVGLFMLFLGIRMLLGPLAVLADVLPPIGALVRMGTSMAAALVALPLGVATIALGWLVYRPLLGVLLLVAAGGLGVLLYRAARGRAPAPARIPAPVSVSPPPPPPPPPAS